MFQGKKDRHAGVLFYFDEMNKFIIHRQGKNWIPYDNFRDSYNPEEDAPILLESNTIDGARL